MASARDDFNSYLLYRGQKQVVDNLLYWIRETPEISAEEMVARAAVCLAKGRPECADMLDLSLSDAEAKQNN